jgi:hypothetical protein
MAIQQGRDGNFSSLFFPCWKPKGKKRIFFVTINVVIPNPWDDNKFFVEPVVRKKSMPQQGTHYERAFESLLCRRKVTYVALNQHEKALMGGAHLKSFDYIVHPREGRRLLVDVKGRKISRHSYERGRLEQTWATHDDVESLEQWETLFGQDYAAVLVFAYWLDDKDQLSLPLDQDVEHYQGRDYAFWVIGLRDYQREMRHRSSRWGTVSVPSRRFIHLAKPLADYPW